jgi:hypothetical protein
MALAIDSSDAPHLVWWWNRHLYYSRLAGDSWLTPQRLDSVEAGYLPSLCLDPWGQDHVTFSDWGLGYRERVRSRNGWEQALQVSSDYGTGETVVGLGRLHDLWDRGTDIWYSYRELNPPGMGEEPSTLVLQAPGPVLSPVGERTSISFVLCRRSAVDAEILDTSGRLVAHVNLGRLPPGAHSFEPWRYLPTSGVYLCRLKTENEVKTVKLVGVD